MPLLSMAIVNEKRMGVFFCDINEQRWQLIGEQLDSAKPVMIWQTIDNRVDRQEIWWNVILLKLSNLG